MFGRIMDTLAGDSGSPDPGLWDRIWMIDDLMIAAQDELDFIQDELDVIENE